MKLNIVKKISMLLTTALVVSMFSGCSSNDNSEDGVTTFEDSKKLVMTHVTSPLNVPSIIQKHNSILEMELEKNNNPTRVDYAEITSGSEQTQALASKDVDILYGVGGTSVVLAAANGADIKVLNMYSRSPEAFTMYSKDDSIKSAEDLKGKTIAGPVGTNLHQLLIAYLNEAGMSIGDVNFVNMSIPNAKAGLDNGSVDVALIAGPTAYTAKKQGYNLITDGKGLTDAIIAVAVTEEFYNNNRDIIKIFMDSQNETLKFMNDNYDKVIDIVAKELDLEKSAVEEMYKQYDFSIEITEEDKKAFENIEDFMFETNMIEKEYDTNNLFINE